MRMARSPKRRINGEKIAFSRVLNASHRTRFQKARKEAKNMFDEATV